MHALAITAVVFYGGIFVALGLAGRKKNLCDYCGKNHMFCECPPPLG